MKKRITFKKIVLLLLVAILLFIAYVGYRNYLAPTKVGLINYPGFLYTKVAKSNDNSFIAVENLRVDSLPSNLDNYDMLLIFGMGIRMPASEEQKIKKAAEKGVSVYLQSSTNPRLKLTNIGGEILDNIDGYLGNGGRKNYKNMLNYIRLAVDNKTFKTDSIIAPEEIPADVLFYTDEDAIFEKVTDFDAYCQKNKLHKKNQDNVIIFTSVPGPFNSNREHLNSLITELQSRNLNVYPIAGFSGRVDYMQEIKPKLVVYMPHGRLSMGGSPKRMDAWLKKQNVPILCPITVFQEYDKWLTDKMGLFGGLLSQSVTMPEFDGGIVPYAVFAQEKDKNGLLLFKAIPNRLKKFGDIVKNYLSLPKKNNADKKLAFVYFKGPGKNALNASNMEVLPSLHNTLLRLQKEGYNLGDLPNDFKTFRDRIMSEGPVLGPYAVGAFEKYLKSGKPELVEATVYNQWRKKSLPTELITAMDERYGKAPGAYMGISKNSKDYLAITAVKFGNVALLPQPLPGIGDNEYALVHGAKVAPPHPYVGAYLWIQHQFKADAIFHFGTHGSLEFTPGKQIALSEYDWTDPLIGTTPHFYIYTISNVGEGMIAKRRSYAATQTYLTPPFIEAQAFAKRAVMHEKLHKYEQAKGALKTQYALSVKKLAVKEGIHKDIGLDSILTKPYTDAEMMKLANYLEEVEHEKVTGGLYTMGVPYSPKHLKENMQLMMVDALAYSLADIDIVKGKITPKQVEDKMFFNEKYTHRCEPYIHKVMQTKNPDAVFAMLVSKADLARAEAWEDAKNQQNANMFGHGRMHARKQGKQVDEKIQLRNLIIKISPDEKKRKFISKLESNKEYQRALSLLEPQNFARAAKMAKFIPAMKKALQTASDSDIKAILNLIKKEEMRQLALKYLSDKNLAAEVAKETQKQHNALLQKALTKEMQEAITFADAKIATATLAEAKMLKRKLDFYNANKKVFLAMKNAKKEQQLIAFLKDKLAAKLQLVNLQIQKLENKEDNFAAAVFKVKSTLKSVLVKKQALQNSPEMEFEAILNALNGGYTAPSTGGDPISNPETVPTGRNLVSVDAEKTPTKEAWNVGKKLGDAMLADFRKKHDGKYPEKVSFTLWSSSFIESEGTTIGEILYLMGVKPVWNFFGKVTDIRIIPEEELKRPRIDVVVQTSGQLRDLAASRLFLINKAIAKVANEAKSENNYISKGVADAEKRLIEKGYSPKEARNLSTKRVFGGVNGNYGTGIMGMVENSDRWDSTKVVAQTYIKNMGAVYGDQKNWGNYEAGVFEAALLNTQAVVQPRQSNTWGALSLDHVYEFMGGINLAVKEVTGNDAESYFNDFRNTSNPRIQGLKEAVWVETRTTLLNPRYIKEYMKGGASSAETFAETFRNTFGWNVMKPSVIENRLWDKLYDTYVKDKQNLGVKKFFERENPYALQEMTAVMLETVRKNMWKATPEQVKTLAKLHAELVAKHEAGCSGFVCDNKKLKSFIDKQLAPDQKQAYNKQITAVREESKEQSKDNVILKKQQKIQPKTAPTSESSYTGIVAVVVVGVIILLLLFIRRRRNG